MARIEVPVTNQIAAGGIMNTIPGVSIGSISQAAGNIGSNAASLASTSLSMANDYRRDFDRAKLMADEKSFLNVLSRTVPEVTEEIGAIHENAVNMLTAIDEQEYAKELKFVEDMYMMDSTGMVEAQYRKAYEQHGSNPAMMQNFLNNMISDHLVKAPSKSAQFKYMGQMYRFKYVALQEQLDAEKASRAASRADALARQEERSAQALFEYPDDLKLFMGKADQAEKIVSNEGGTPEQASMVGQRFRQTMVDNSIRGLMNQGRSEEALTNLGSPTINQFLNPELRAQHTESATRQLLEREYVKKKEAKQMLDIENFSKGYLQPGLPGADQGSYLHFQSFITSNLDGGNNLGQQDFQAASSDISAYFKRYNSYMAADTRNYITGRIKNSNNPYEVSAYAMAMDDIINDDSFKGLNIGASFAEGDKSSVVEAMSISRLVRAGEDPVAAIQKVRQDLRESNPALIASREAQVKQYWEDNSPQDTINSLYGSRIPFKSDPTNMLEMEERFKQSYMDYYRMSGDTEVAQKAAKAQISKNYQPSTINGRKEVMFGAPDIYFRGNMEEFEDQYLSTIKSLAESAGGKMIDERRAEIGGRNVEFELRGVRGLTDGGDGKRTYIIFDRNTGRPLLTSTGSYAGFSFGQSKADVEKQLEEYNNEKLRQRDAALLETDRQTRSKFLNGDAFKKATEGLPESLKRDIIGNIKKD